MTDIANTAAQRLRAESTGSKAQEIADVLVEQLDEWYSLPETWDNELDAQIHRWYADVKPVWPKRPYFSPSAAKSCPRSLYFKQLRAKQDKQRKPPYQGRWQAIGTAVGSLIQRDILAMERNMPGARFSFERNDDGTPVFEDFAKTNTQITHGGRTFYLYGTCDGIMRYVDDETGEILRVGLEIKSKQTTAARTSLYSMREAEQGHVTQCALYAAMYNVDYYVILYVNTSKKAWVYPEGEYEKSPDIRAFGVAFDSEAQRPHYDKFVAILDAVETKRPPTLDLTEWTFNPFKTACATSLTAEELAELESQVNAVKASGLKPFDKAKYADAWADILRLREEAN